MGETSTVSSRATGAKGIADTVRGKDNLLTANLGVGRVHCRRGRICPSVRLMPSILDFWITSSNQQAQVLYAVRGTGSADGPPPCGGCHAAT